MLPKPHHQYDINYKNLFSDPDMVASLLRSFAPADVVAEMDFSSLEPYPTEHITEDLRERHNDIVWRIRIKESYCYFLFLLEFQSTEDWWMAVRILAYTALVWQDIIKAGKLEEGDKLPPVFPLVLYNGGSAWKAPTDLRELISPHGKTLEPYQPQQQYFLLDAGRVPAENLAGTNEFATLLIRFERAHTVEEIIQILTEFCALLPASKLQHLHRALISWLGETVFKRTKISKDILHCSTIQEAQAMLADIAPHWEETFMERGRNEGISIGRDEGISIGEARGISLGIKNILQEILTHRFGTLPNDVAASIDGISNTDDLKNLTHEAYQVSSFQAFCELLNHIRK